MTKRAKKAVAYDALFPIPGFAGAFVCSAVPETAWIKLHGADHLG